VYGDPLPPGAVQRLGATRFRHDGHALSLTFTADGLLVAHCGGDQVCCWDAATGRLVRCLRPGQALRSIDFAPDGKTIGTAEPAGARLRDAAGGKVRLALPGPTDALDQGAGRVRFSPDGKLLAATGLANGAWLFDARTGRPLFDLQGQTGAVSALAFSPDGKTLATAATEPAVALWDVAAGKLRHSFGTKLSGPATTVAFSPDGRTVAWGAWNTIGLADAITGLEQAKLDTQQMHFVNGLAFTPDGKTLLSTSQDGRLRFWALATRQARRCLDARMGCLTALALAADGQTVAVGSFDKRLRLWDVRTGKERLPGGRGHGGAVQAVAFAADGKSVVTASGAQEVLVWDAATAEALCEVPLARAETVALTAGGSCLATAGLRPLLHVRDLMTGRALHKLAVPPGEYTCLALAPSGHAAALGMGKAIYLSDPEMVEESTVLGGTSLVSAAAFAPDGRTVATAGSGGTVRLWETATGKEVLTLHRPVDEVTAVSFSPDGCVLAAACRDRPVAGGRAHQHHVRLWHVATGRELALLRGPQIRITALAFSPDGRRLACGLADTTTLLCEVEPLPAVTQKEDAPVNLDSRWADLGGADAAGAYRAIWAVAATSDRGVAYLRARLPPFPPQTGDEIRRLIADLDSDKYSVREAATRRLRDLGRLAEPFVREARVRKSSLEVQRRLDKLAEAVRGPLSPEVLRGVRAVQALERIGTPAARQVLEALAAGAPEARLTREARAAVERLATRPGP
jgi:WD40 repeat protein